MKTHFVAFILVIIASLCPNDAYDWQKGGVEDIPGKGPICKMNSGDNCGIPQSIPFIPGKETKASEAVCAHNDAFDGALAPTYCKITGETKDPQSGKTFGFQCAVFSLANTPEMLKIKCSQKF